MALKWDNVCRMVGITWLSVPISDWHSMHIASSLLAEMLNVPVPEWLTAADPQSLQS